jgi:ribonuclease Y
MPTHISVLALLALLAVALALVGGFGAAFLLLRRRQSNGSDVLELKAQQTVLEAETQAKEKLLEAKEEAVKIRTAAEQEAREYRAQSQQIEKRLLQKEENLDRKSEDLNRSERELAAQKKSLDDIKAQLEESYRQQEKELQRVANMTRQEAQGILMAQVEQDLRNEVARKVRESVTISRAPRSRNRDRVDSAHRRRPDRRGLGFSAAAADR